VRGLRDGRCEGDMAKISITFTDDEETGGVKASVDDHGNEVDMHDLSDAQMFGYKALWYVFEHVASSAKVEGE